MTLPDTHVYTNLNQLALCVFISFVEFSAGTSIGSQTNKGMKHVCMHAMESCTMLYIMKIVAI